MISIFVGGEARMYIYRVGCSSVPDTATRIVAVTCPRRCIEHGDRRRIATYDVLGSARDGIVGCASESCESEAPSGTVTVDLIVHTF